MNKEDEVIKYGSPEFYEAKETFESEITYPSDEEFKELCAWAIEKNRELFKRFADSDRYNLTNGCESGHKN